MIQPTFAPEPHLGSPAFLLLDLLFIIISWFIAQVDRWFVIGNNNNIADDDENPKNDRPGDDGMLRIVKLLVFLLGVIDLASASA